MKKICMLSAVAGVTTLMAGPMQAPADTQFVIQKDPALAELIDSNAKLEKIAGGFEFTEGALWVPKGRGYLLIAEMPGNVIYRWTPDGKVAMHMEKSGSGSSRPRASTLVQSVYRSLAPMLNLATPIARRSILRRARASTGFG